MALTKDEMKVLLNIISACETGGQVYGKGRYDDFTPAYANSSTEHGITIGKYQHYANEAKELLRRIQKANPELFNTLDTEDIGSDLRTRNWAYYKILKGSAKAKCIQKIISSDVGIRVQDEMVAEQMAKYVEEAEKLGVTDHQAQCMAANWRHQGGLGAVKRILAKTKKPYTLDNLYEACKTDTGNQVGAYKTRQKLVYNWLKTYWPQENNPKKYGKDFVHYYQVNGTSALNVREDAGTQNKIVGVLHDKQIVKCNGFFKKIGDVKWLYITYDDVGGYASSKYLKKFD